MFSRGLTCCALVYAVNLSNRNTVIHREIRQQFPFVLQISAIDPLGRRTIVDDRSRHIADLFSGGRIDLQTWEAVSLIE